MEDDEDEVYEATESAIIEMLEEEETKNLKIEYAMMMIGFINEFPDLVPYPVQGSVWNFMKRYFNEDIT